MKYAVLAILPSSNGGADDGPGVTRTDGRAERVRPLYPRRVSPRTQPEQHPPPVQWLRLRYARRGRARFTSHRDFSRAFERALRRAEVPMAYSSGFSPHPRISYANAAPTGAASEAEFLEIGLTDTRRPRAAARTAG